MDDLGVELSSVLYLKVVGSLDDDGSYAFGLACLVVDIGSCAN